MTTPVYSTLQVTLKALPYASAQVLPFVAVAEQAVVGQEVSDVVLEAGEVIKACCRLLVPVVEGATMTTTDDVDATGVAWVLELVECGATTPYEDTTEVLEVVLLKAIAEAVILAA